MKKTLKALLIALLSFTIYTSVLAQSSATQTLTLTVNTLSKITLSNSTLSLTIVDGTAGENDLTPVSNALTTYSIMHNSKAGVRKITASINAVLDAGYVLKINLASDKGTSAGDKDISNATTAVEVVTNISKGADKNKVITYTFSATAEAGNLTAINRDVVLTLTN